MVVDRFLDLKRGRKLKNEILLFKWAGVKQRNTGKKDSTLVPMVGTRPTAAMYVLPIVLIFSISL